MESAVIARRCRAEGVPFGCVRAISDDAATHLSPRVVSMLAGGRVSPTRLCRALITDPGLISDLWRLARNTRRAATALAAVLHDVLRNE
jgi:hypothetical protein